MAGPSHLEHLGRPFALTAAIVLLLAACTGGTTAVPVTHPPTSRPSPPATTPSHPTSPSPASGAVPNFSHVAIVMFENKEYGDVIGNPQAPYFNSLAHAGGLATEFHAITHPSLPNYIALVAGSTLGVSNNCRRCTLSDTSLIDQLGTAGLSWKAYMEGAPGPCDPGASPRPHAPNPRKFPFLYFSSIANDPARCADVVPLTQLSTDLKAKALPQFLWIGPDLCHSMHDCPVSAGDAFLKGLLPSLLAGMGPDGVVFVTFDEGTTNDGCCQQAAGGRIATILAGGAVMAGAVSAVPYDHYSILRTIEQAWGLPLLRGAACPCTAAMRALVRPG